MPQLYQGARAVLCEGFAPSTTMRIDVPQESEKASRFLNCLRACLEGKGEWRGEGRLAQDGTFISSMTIPISVGDGKTVMTQWKTAWSARGSVQPIEVTASSDEAIWKGAVEELIRKAYVMTINPDAVKVFSRNTFVYQGPLLSGEYYLPGFRLAPAPQQDEKAFLLERVIHIDQEVQSVNRGAALGIGQVLARRYASLLAVFLDQGFHEIPVEHHWVYVPGENGKLKSKCLQRGYVSPVPQPTQMPEKEKTCAPGAFHEVERDQFRNERNFVNEPLTCPKDIRRLFRIVQGLLENEREAYYGAAALFQMAQIQRARYPSVALAYEVAAVDALKQAGDDASFYSLISEYIPGVPKKLTDQMYAAVRSAHFHAGKFPGGEFESLSIGPFMGPEHLERINASQAGHAIARYVLLKWLLKRDQQKDTEHDGDPHTSCSGRTFRT